MMMTLRELFSRDRSAQGRLVNFWRSTLKQHRSGSALNLRPLKASRRVQCNLNFPSSSLARLSRTMRRSICKASRKYFRSGSSHGNSVFMVIVSSWWWDYSRKGWLYKDVSSHQQCSQGGARRLYKLARKAPQSGVAKAARLFHRN